MRSTDHLSVITVDDSQLEGRDRSTAAAGKKTHRLMRVLMVRIIDPVIEGYPGSRLSLASLGDTETMVEALDTHVIVTSGQKAMLACRFHHPDRQVAHSSVQFIWIRQSHAAFDADAILAHNQDLLIADPRLLVQRTESEYSLTIADVDSNDEGVYACEINTQPLQRALIHLYVQGKLPLAERKSRVFTFGRVAPPARSIRACCLD